MTDLLCNVIECPVVGVLNVFLFLFLNFKFLSPIAQVISWFPYEAMPKSTGNMTLHLRKPSLDIRNITVP